jgi:hypothetical protein
MRKYGSILKSLTLAAMICVVKNVHATAGAPDTAASEAKPGAVAVLRGAFAATRPIAEVRIRYESVDQPPITEQATSGTLRLHLGFESGKAWGTALIVEGEAVVPLLTDYNSTSNGNTAYPVVADPESYEINRLQLVNTSLPSTTITLGRQRINLDDQRFVGNAGWRQNEQTFDSLRVVSHPVAPLTLDVSYVDRVNRIYGPNGGSGPTTGRFTGDSWLTNLSWQFAAGKLTTFGYLVDIEQQPVPARDSSQTYGLRFAGEQSVSGVKLSYIVSWASQQDWADNPLDFRNDYLLAELRGSYRSLELGLGHEVLEGNGQKGFTTPLATLHRFQGWADKFTTTPVNGVRDSYVIAGYQRKAAGPFQALAINAIWHHYDSARGGLDFGKEINLQLQARYGRVTGLLKYADYQVASATPPTLRDTGKFWAQMEFAW